MTVAINKPILPDSVDTILGKSIRSIRMSCGISQHTLGKAVGVSFQQIQKYENGKSRISGVRLLAVANYLGIPIKDFFRGLDHAASENDFPEDVDKIALEMISLFNSLHSQQTKKALINLIKGQIGNQNMQAFSTRSTYD